MFKSLSPYQLGLFTERKKCNENPIRPGDKFILTINDKRVFVVESVKNHYITGVHGTNTIYCVKESQIIQVTDSDIKRMNLIDKIPNPCRLINVEVINSYVEDNKTYQETHDIYGPFNTKLYREI